MGFFLVLGAISPLTSAEKPNIIMIMGDDIGMWNIGAYHRGLVAARTPNIDKLANEGMMFTEARIGNHKYTFVTQPQGWFGVNQHVDWPILTNLRLDSFERAAGLNQSTLAMDWYGYEFWRFVFVQQEGASFNLDAVKSKIQKLDTNSDRQT